MKHFVPFLIVSIAIHFLFVFSIKISHQQATRQLKKVIQVSVVERKPVKKLNEINDENRNGQVVSQPLNKNNEKPKNSRFLSERDSSTEKESVRHGNSVEKSGDGDDVDQDKKQIEKAKVDGINLFPKEAINNTANEISQREKRSGSTREHGTVDSLDGIKEGEGTFLNTSAFKYATFFNRIKESLVAKWHPWEEVSFYGQKNNP